MHGSQDRESRAIARLVAQIDSIDGWREWVPRRILGMFGVTFVFALGLLVYVALFEGPPPEIRRPEGPRAPVVLRSAGP